MGGSDPIDYELDSAQGGAGEGAAAPGDTVPVVASSGPDMAFASVPGVAAGALQVDYVDIGAMLGSSGAAAAGDPFRFSTWDPDANTGATVGASAQALGAALDGASGSLLGEFSTPHLPGGTMQPDPVTVAGPLTPDDAAGSLLVIFDSSM
jgi:hypothetical protein